MEKENQGFLAAIKSEAKWPRQPSDWYFDAPTAKDLEHEAYVAWCFQGCPK